MDAYAEPPLVKRNVSVGPPKSKTLYSMEILGFRPTGK